MKLEEKLKELGFKQSPKIQDQRINRELEVYVYVENDKIETIQISKSWCLKFNDLSNYSDYITKVRILIEKINCIL